MGAMGAALKRGEGPRKARSGSEKSTWPHIKPGKLAEVPLHYPLTKKRPSRVLFESMGSPSSIGSAMVSPLSVSGGSALFRAGFPSTPVQGDCSPLQADPRSSLNSRAGMASRGGLESRGADREGLGSSTGSRRPLDSRGGVRRGRGLQSRQSSAMKLDNSQVLNAGDSMDTMNNSKELAGCSAEWDASDYDLFGSQVKSFEEDSYLSGFRNFQGKRLRGEPLPGLLDFAAAQTDAAARSRPSTSSKVLSPIQSPSHGSSLPSPQNLSRPGTVNLEFERPSRGVFRSALRPEPDVHGVGSGTDGLEVSGRPAVKGNLRSFLPPASPPLAAMQLPKHLKEDPERMVKPTMNALLTGQHSRMTPSTPSLFSSRPLTSTEQAVSSTTSVSATESEVMAMSGGVPTYFMPFISASMLHPHPPDLRRKAALSMRVPDPAKMSTIPLPEVGPFGVIADSYGFNSEELLQDLYSVRRANPKLDETSDAYEGELGMTLAELCIRDCADTPEVLMNGMEILRQTIAEARLHGCAQHPTISLSKRALRVVERKYKLLEPLVKSLTGFEKLIKNDSAEMIEKIIDGGDPEALYGFAFGMRETLQDGLHQPFPGAGDALGRPQDADKLWSLDFQESFGLCADHMSVLRVRQHIKEECADMAVLAAERMQDIVKAAAARGDTDPRSPEADAVARVEVFLEGLGTHLDHPSVLKVGRCKEAARAAALLRYANTECPAPAGKDQLATFAAERLEKEIEAAIEFGVDEDHPDLKKAVMLGIHLRAEAVARFARMKTSTMGNRLGDAAEVAEKIEGKVEEAVAAGIPMNIEELEEARKIAVKAREAEGLKRREHNREKAKMEAAAKAAAAEKKAADAAAAKAAAAAK